MVVTLRPIRLPHNYCHSTVCDILTFVVPNIKVHSNGLRFPRGSTHFQLTLVDGLNLLTTKRNIWVVREGNFLVLQLLGASFFLAFWRRMVTFAKTNNCLSNLPGPRRQISHSHKINLVFTSTLDGLRSSTLTMVIQPFFGPWWISSEQMKKEFL